MDVTFSSSGALSRAHYAIVRKVEMAVSPQQADQFIALEVRSVHERLSKRSLNLKECKECLVILLYCAAATTPGFLPVDALQFGLFHALNLAEAGKTIEDKRIGYLFCTELMPPEHELRLMMVNTLRKDLESPIIGRICLALDNLICFANNDVVPAVQDTLRSLLSHNYPNIRRRAILALRALSVFEPQLLTQESGTIVRCLQGADESVMGAALTCSTGIPSSDPNFSKLRKIANEIFSSMGAACGSSIAAISLRIMQSLQILGMSETNIMLALKLAKSSSALQQPALLLGIFRLLSQQSTGKLIAAESGQETSIVRFIQDFLTSHDPNDQYLYLACLTCLDPIIWAGTSPDRPAVLEGWEVEKIMQFLESRDDLIRKMTLNLLALVDPSIVTAYLYRSLEGLGPGLDLATLNAWSIRMIDAVEVLSREDGEKYAQGIKDILNRLSSSEIMARPGVLQDAVEKVLLHLRSSSYNFRISCVTTLLTYMADSTTTVGQTYLVISAALAVEYMGSTPVPPASLLHALCLSLNGSPPVVQDASLLAILRLVAECDGAPLQLAVETIEELRQHAGRHIQKRCGQVLNLCSDKSTLNDIIRNARSQTLPGFLEALEQPSQASSNVGTSARIAAPSHKLRYAAYDQPQPARGLRYQRSTSAHGSQSDTTSDRGLEHRSSQDSVDAVNASLAAVSLGLNPNSIARPSPTVNIGTPHDVGPYLKTLDPFLTVPQQPLIARSDLITLDSPFVSDANVAEVSVSEEFETVWNSLADSKGARGWCGASDTVLLRRLQMLDNARLKVAPSDTPPFIGELKVILHSTTQIGTSVVLRLRKSEDGSCLWRLKSEDEGLRKLVKDLLNEDA